MAVASSLTLLLAATALAPASAAAAATVKSGQHSAGTLLC